VRAQAFADAPLSTEHFDNAAVNGHNTIIYQFLLLDDKAVKGVKTFSVQWRGASWHFNSDEELQRFSATPEIYAPA
jgi:hypothetical protein